MTNIAECERLVRRLAGERSGTRTIMFRELRNYRVVVPQDSLWGAVKDNLLLSEYERNNVRLKRCHGLVIDAGAHVGLFTLRASSYARQVIALEPHPDNYCLLEYNLRQNGVTNVRAMRRALWSSAERLRIFNRQETGGASVLGGSRGAHDTEAVTLDQLVASHGQVDLVKLDIEGAEFQVLATASDAALRSVRLLVAELHLEEAPTAAVEAVEARLKGLGFDVQILPPPIANPREALPRVIRNWSNSADLVRLKLMVLGVYALAGLVNSVTARQDDAHLKFLFAAHS